MGYLSVWSSEYLLSKALSVSVGDTTTGLIETEIVFSGDHKSYIAVSGCDCSCFGSFVFKLFI